MKYNIVGYNNSLISERSREYRGLPTEDQGDSVFLYIKELKSCPHPEKTSSINGHH
ncbi:hypothetical protein [Aequorivita ciconiae]|uniref:hypothetical protein n=1 Tax=Aequorivita ciconiae TaxID=2494375 RepID=UPI0013E2EDA3|nr:hypothetical protein [Aequorivita sp. H23M31]